jgi:hypothetical protein
MRKNRIVPILGSVSSRGGYVPGKGRENRRFSGHLPQIARGNPARRCGFPGLRSAHLGRVNGGFSHNRHPVRKKYWCEEGLDNHSFRTIVDIPNLGGCQLASRPFNKLPPDCRGMPRTDGRNRTDDFPIRIRSSSSGFDEKSTTLPRISPACREPALAS